MAEEVAEGWAQEVQRARALEDAAAALRGMMPLDGGGTLLRTTADVQRMRAGAVFELLGSAHIGWSIALILARTNCHFDRAQQRANQATQVSLLRCVVGNPFLTSALSESWLTPTVKTLVRVIHNQRRYEDMPILGDALEDAGCADEGILGHCRDSHGHARGCWVVDLLQAAQER